MHRFKQSQKKRKETEGKENVYKMKVWGKEEQH
jgi:hypothetical protein